MNDPDYGVWSGDEPRQKVSGTIVAGWIAMILFCAVAWAGVAMAVSLLWHMR